MYKYLMQKHSLTDQGKMEIFPFRSQMLPKRRVLEKKHTSGIHVKGKIYFQVSSDDFPSLGSYNYFLVGNN